MRDIFINMGALMLSKFFKDLPKAAPDKTDRVLKSLRIEDEIYRETCAGNDAALHALEDRMAEKLPTFKALSRDLFQSFYALNVRHNAENELTPMARKFNRYIVNHMMEAADYPAIKAICEGHELPAFEAAQEYMKYIAAHLDELMAAANGEKQTPDALAKQEARQDRRLDELQALVQRWEKSPAPDPALEKKILRMANRAYGKVRQLEAMARMVDDLLLKNDGQIRPLLQAAERAAKNKALEVWQILLSWGNDPANMRSDPLNSALLQRVRRCPHLLDISKFLGRFREMMRQKRKNATIYGRGEKYSVELGKNLQRVISSEYGMLATPETIPLFLRKLQRGALKQYQRRERVCKGQGDKIVCLDESFSTKGTNAAWGKAIAFALLDTARMHRRSFALIHFSSENEFKTDIFPAGHGSPDDVMAAAETFLDGGTNYVTPLREAIRLMETGTFRDADVVFITDGECRMPEDFVTELKQKQAAMHFTVTGILMDQDSLGMKFSLTPFCTEIYRISELGGDGIADRLLSKRL